MPRSVTLTELQTEIRNSGEVRDPPISDTTLTTWINAAYAELYNHVIDANVDHFLSTATETIVAGTDSYALPSDYYKTIAVWVLDTDNERYPLERFNWSERYLYSDSGLDRRCTRYALKGANLILSPSPTWSGTVYHDYIPEPAELSSGGDTIGDVMAAGGWEKYIVADCLIRFCAYEESDPQTFVLQKQEALRAVIMSAGSRDEGNPKQVRNMRHERSGKWFNGWR